MFKNFSRVERNLRWAGYVLAAEIFSGISLAIVLRHFGLPIDVIALFALVANLPAVWFLAQAARQQGRNAWLTGVTSLPPLVALINFLSLWATTRRYENEV